MKVVAVLAAGVLLAATCLAESKLYRVPVPLSIEGKYQPSSLHLLLQMELYNEPLAAFDAKSLDTEETAFRDVAQAIRTNKAALLSKLIEAKSKSTAAAAAATSAAASDDPLAGSRPTPTVIERSNTPDAIAASYRAAFNNFADLQVIARVNLGDHSLFLWRSPGGKMNRLRGFLTSGTAQSAKVTELTMERPVETFITNSLGELPDFQLAKFELSNSKPEEGRYRLALGNSTAQLEFAGKPYAVDAYDDSLVLEEPLKTYRDAWSAFKKQDFEKFLRSMAPESRTRFARFLESVKAEGTEAFYIKASGPRYIRFVIDAYPAYLVFVAPTKENTWNAGALQSDMLYQSGNRLELVNAVFRTFFDDIIKNNRELEALIRDVQPAVPQAGR